MALIAIIEDDVALADMYKLKLDVSGFSTMVAYDGKAGLDMITTKTPDLILLDLMLPEMIGSDVLAAYRKTEKGKNVKVLVMTNVSEYEAPEELKTLDVYRYLVKANYTPSEVIKIVQEALGVTPEPQTA